MPNFVGTINNVCEKELGTTQKSVPSQIISTYSQYHSYTFGNNNRLPISTFLDTPSTPNLT